MNNERKKILEKRKIEINEIKEQLKDYSTDELAGLVIFYMIKCGEIK